MAIAMATTAPKRGPSTADSSAVDCSDEVPTLTSVTIHPAPACIRGHVGSLASMRRLSRRVRQWWALLGVAGLLLVGTAVPSASLPVGQVSVTAAAEPPLKPTPQAECGLGSIPEPGMQGRVAADEVESGRVSKGYRCNVKMLSHIGRSGGYKVERFVDKAGNECAYYDTTLLFPSNAANLSEQPTGVHVLDMSNPRKPVRTAELETPAMQSPHESLVLNQKRGLLAAVMGNPFFAPGQVDVYDLNADCREPELKSSAPVGLLGHESGFAPDGKTLYASSLGGGTLTAVDVSNPSAPHPIHVGRFDTHSLSISDDGNTAYLAASPGFPRNEFGLPTDFAGLLIVDVSEIQSREPVPQTKLIGAVTWDSVTIPQNTIPVTIDGKPYIVETDEFSLTEDGAFRGNAKRVGAARIIDIADPTKPRVISNMRLEVHQPENRDKLADDPGASSSTQGYAGHYCNVPQRKDPGIVACSFINSGLRVFDITDPHKPTEIAYFVPPLDPGDSSYAMSSPTIIPERKEIWYSDANSGFYALRLTNDVWPAGGTKTDPRTDPRDDSDTAPDDGARDAGDDGDPALPATGGTVPVAVGLLLFGAAFALRTRRARS